MLHQLFAPNFDDLYQMRVELEVRVELKEIRYVKLLLWFCRIIQIDALTCKISVKGQISDTLHLMEYYHLKNFFFLVSDT